MIIIKFLVILIVLIKKLNGKCPFELVEKYIPLTTLKKMKIKKVPDSEVNLTLFLLSTKNIENINGI